MKRMYDGSSGPVWLRSQVPVAELGQWVRGMGPAGGLERAALYLLEAVLEAYGWEQEAAWAWEQGMWEEQVGVRLGGMVRWMEQVTVHLRRAVTSWETVVSWLERRSEPEMEVWKQWVTARIQQLLEERGRVCQDCVERCQQAQRELPAWVLIELGLVAEDAEAGGETAAPSLAPGFSVQGSQSGESMDRDMM